MKLKLIRDKDTGEATLGRLYAEGKLICYTLENTWIDNKRNISCIPEGNYSIELKEYGRFYDKYKHPIIKLTDVPGRSEILIHKGNYAKDTQGCILIGDSLGENAVWNSSKTYDRLYNLLSNSTEITIK